MSTNWTKWADGNDAGLLVLRVAAGGALAYLHGWAKLAGAWGYFAGGQDWRFVGAVTELGFPAPAYFALAAALAESVGALLLALGLFTRANAAWVAITMVVAIYRHWTAGQGAELAWAYLVAAVGLALAGPGRLAVDRWLGERAGPRWSRAKAVAA